MKNWGLLIALFYAAVLIALTVPLDILCFWGSTPIGTTIFRAWGYWLWIAVMGLGAFLLLFVPVRIAEERLRSRRPLLVPIITGGFLYLVLMAGIVFSAGAGIWGDSNVSALTKNTVYEPLFDNGWTWVAIGLVVWAFWAALFYEFSKTCEPEGLIQRLASWLLAGSVLEFLVALISHIVVRNRKDCCAPGVTFLGIAAGISIMLLSFGPSIYFLFVKRMKRIQPKV